MRILLSLSIILFSINLYGQMAPNFTVTDVNGQTHNLYTDYLDQDKIVVINVFFVYCPPCNSAAPGFQAKHVQWGSGSQGVQFMYLTNKVTDNNTLVTGFKNQHSLTMPSISAQGGAVQAQALYTGGAFGPFYGTPHYTVIAPDRTVHYDVPFTQIDQIIMDIQGTITAPGTPVKINTNLGASLPSGVSLFMKPANATNPLINITQLTNGTNQFMYPSADFPELVNPVIFMQTNADAQDGSLRAGDLVPIRKHILGLEPFTDPKIIIAADVNGDSKIRSGDLVDLRKVILGLIEDFPNAVPSYKMYPEEVDFNASGTNEVIINLEIVKIGNIVD